MVAIPYLSDSAFQACPNHFQQIPWQLYSLEQYKYISRYVHNFQEYKQCTVLLRNLHHLLLMKHATNWCFEGKQWLPDHIPLRPPPRAGPLLLILQEH